MASIVSICRLHACNAGFSALNISTVQRDELHAALQPVIRVVLDLFISPAQRLFAVIFLG
ncbi:hypothetical protein ACSBOB_32425 [Mesorhizobium sp. ASY16-5R]|uniref:hypothetical protein n=1 Tax=Mesorhizobium sp. ASY16-5R TaxID=3445772 RepID=UPI003F9FC878